MNYPPKQDAILEAVDESMLLKPWVAVLVGGGLSIMLVSREDIKSNTAGYGESSCAVAADIKFPAMVRCPNCGAKVEARMNTCNECGATFRRIEVFSAKQLVVGLSVLFAVIALTQIVTLILFGKPFYGGGQWGVLHLLPAIFGSIWLSRFVALKFVKPLNKLETMLTRQEEQSMREAYDKLTGQHQWSSSNDFISH